MLGAWAEILPLFLVRWLAKDRCTRISMHGEAWCTARPEVLVQLREGGAA